MRINLSLTIVIMKAFNKEEKKNEYDLLLPPEPKSSVKSADEELFKQVPIIEEKSDKKKSFDEMVKKLKEKEVVKKTQEPVASTVQTPTEEVEKKIETPTKEVAKKVDTATKAASDGLSASKGIYVQIGATSQVNPDKKFLKKVTQNGYGYALYRIDVKGKTVTKILIGPYSDLAKAKAALSDIKKSVNKEAFIYKIR